MTRWGVCFLLIAADGAPAQTTRALVLKGCVVETKEAFYMKATGNETRGQIEALSETGVSCNGAWFTMNTGKVFAALNCDDGRRGRGDIAKFDPSRPKIAGTVRLNDDTTLMYWTDTAPLACQK